MSENTDGTPPISSPPNQTTEGDATAQSSYIEVPPSLYDDRATASPSTVRLGRDEIGKVPSVFFRKLDEGGPSFSNYWGGHNHNYWGVIAYLAPPNKIIGEGELVLEEPMVNDNA
jgi:hypothetical protein